MKMNLLHPQKTDHRHPAFRPSGVVKGDVSEVTETDDNLLVFKLPDNVTSSGTVEVIVRTAVAVFGITGIVISIATLVSALLH
jgi:hypothetical protein